MKRLILTRHAKSGWENLEHTDFQRTLNERGLEACRLIGHWLSSNNYIPKEAFSSTATRCIQTWETINSKINSNAKVSYTNDLYHSSPNIILNCLNSATEDVVFLTAHNPGIGEFAEKICKSPPIHYRFLGYPSGATTVVDFNVSSWRQLKFSSGDLMDFVIPSELK